MSLKELRQFEQGVLAKGAVDTADLATLKSLIMADGKVDRAEADFVVELHKRVQHLNPAFERFVYSAVKAHVLTDGKIDAEEAAWLRQMVFADGKVSDRERAFLRELKGEAADAGPAFEALFEEAMKAPQNAHTSGSGR